MKKIFGEFKDFISRGNVMDMAVGVIIGGAFTAIVNSLVSDLLNPILGLITGGMMDFSDLTIPLGGTSITKMLNSLHRKKERQEEQEEAQEKQPRLCPYCRSEIAEDATRCPHCTSQLDA